MAVAPALLIHNNIMIPPYSVELIHILHLLAVCAGGVERLLLSIIVNSVHRGGGQYGRGGDGWWGGDREYCTGNSCFGQHFDQHRVGDVACDGECAADADMDIVGTYRALAERCALTVTGGGYPCKLLDLRVSNDNNDNDVGGGGGGLPENVRRGWNAIAIPNCASGKYCY